jgi:nitroreductase
MQDVTELISTLIQNRQTTLPKRLIAPGPDAVQLNQIVSAAAHAPDHGQLMPWRLILIPPEARADLGSAFSQALVERDAAALPEQLDQAREKALRSPLLMLLVVREGRDDAEVDLAERLISAGCAVQNMLLMATALGFGTALTSGKAMKSVSLRNLFALDPLEHAVCFVNIGTAARGKTIRNRPQVSQYVSTLPVPNP